MTPAMTPNLDLFRQVGYQVCRGVLTGAEIATLHDFLQGAQIQAQQQLLSCLNLPEPESLADFLAGCEQEPERFDVLPTEIRSMLVGHLSLETRLNPLLWTIPRSAGIQALLAEIFPGQPVYMHMPPTARFVLPGHRWSGVPAHQDISYNRHMSDFVTVWVPLVPIDAACGGVIVHAGSGGMPEQPLLPVETNHAKLFWQSGVADLGFFKDQPTFVPGDVLLLNPWIVHESAPNLSDRVRLSVDCRFFTGSSRKHALDLLHWQVMEPQP